MNNYERIKSMTVDEMAEFLRQINLSCGNCKLLTKCKSRNCKETQKQWLMKESEE